MEDWRIFESFNATVFAFSSQYGQQDAKNSQTKVNVCTNIFQTYSQNWQKIPWFCGMLLLFYLTSNPTNWTHCNFSINSQGFWICVDVYFGKYFDLKYV